MARNCNENDDEKIDPASVTSNVKSTIKQVSVEKFVGSYSNVFRNILQKYVKIIYIFLNSYVPL